LVWFDTESAYVAAWVESLGRGFTPPTVKQWLAAVRMLFDWLVVGQVLDGHPAAAVRGPKHIVRTRKTPVLAAREARQLLDSIDIESVVGLRDRALIGLLVFTFARIGAALGMIVADVYCQQRRLSVRLHEKGGKEHRMPCHHNLETYVQDYIEVGDRERPLFRTTIRSTGVLTDRPMTQSYAWRMVQRRARAAGIPTVVCNHTFRATGITAYLDNGGSLENAQNMAAHEGPRTIARTTRVTLDEVENIGNLRTSELFRWSILKRFCRYQMECGIWHDKKS
jgi:site-specific recombinase XerD